MANTSRRWRIVCSASSARCWAAARPARRRSSSSSVTSKLRAASSGVPCSARLRSRASACWTVRGNPSSTNPAWQSRSARRSMTMAMTTSSGTRSPRSMYSWAARPSSVPSATFARKMSPVAMWGQPNLPATSAACVPFPAPGGPRKTMRIGAPLGQVWRPQSVGGPLAIGPIDRLNGEYRDLLWRGAGMLPQIEAFLQVARRQNLSQAAEALFVSQPTLTARLQSLEAALGEQLFVRTRRGMRLTEAGETFLPFAEHALAALADGRERLDELRRGVAGRLVLGAPPTVSTYTLPDLLARFSAAYPKVRLAVKTGTSEEILEMVLHDQVQLGIIRALHHTELESVPLYTDALVLIAGPGHRLAGPGADGQARLADLAGEVLVLFGRSSSFLEFTTATFRQAGVLPRSVR